MNASYWLDIRLYWHPLKEMFKLLLSFSSSRFYSGNLMTMAGPAVGPGLGLGFSSKPLARGGRGVIFYSL